MDRRGGAVVGRARCRGPNPEPAGPSPWRLDKVSKLSYAPDDEPPKGAAEGPQKFLYLRVQLPPNVAEPKLHQFRVTDAQGKTVAEAYGFYEKNSLVVFEGDWKDLQGLYLDGLGQREPLFQEPDQRPKPEPGARRVSQGVEPAASHREKAVGQIPREGQRRRVWPGGGGSGVGRGRRTRHRGRVGGRRTVTTIVPPVVVPPEWSSIFPAGRRPARAGSIKWTRRARSWGSSISLTWPPVWPFTGLAGWSPSCPATAANWYGSTTAGSRYVLAERPAPDPPGGCRVPGDSDTIVVADDIATCWRSRTSRREAASLSPL